MTTDGRSRKLLIGLVVVAAIILAKLFYIQIINDKYKINASNNSMVYDIIYPTRGIIYDRNGKIIVGNKVAYDILVTPREVQQFDTLMLASVLEVSPDLIRTKMAEYEKNKRKIGYQSMVMLKQVKPETYMKFAELQYNFPGFKGQARSIRYYPVNAGGNLLGYVSEVDQDYIDKHPGEYRPGDYAGKTGIEAAREKDLRGEKGYHIYLRNSRNQIEQRYRDGEFDKEAIPGHDIVTTIDSDLQQYGQRLMNNKVGSLVAIEPKTGEILTLVSSPGVDVSMLSDFGQHYAEILKDPHKPMFNRAVQAPYPPGSVFKLVNGLIGLQEGTLNTEMAYPCSHGYHFGNHKLGCHGHRSPLKLEEAIMMSCNGYFCYVLKAILENKKYKSIDDAMDKWNAYVQSFGFGHKLGSDFPAELGGTIPSSKLYNKRYGKGGWKRGRSHSAPDSQPVGHGREQGMVQDPPHSEGVRGSGTGSQILREAVHDGRHQQLQEGDQWDVEGRQQRPRLRLYRMGGGSEGPGHMRKDGYGTEPARRRQLGVHLLRTEGRPEDRRGGLCRERRLRCHLGGSDRFAAD